MASRVIDLRGDKELMRELKKLSGPKLRAVLRPAVRAAFQPVARTAKMLAPVRTGQLRKSIGVIVHRTGRTGNIVVSVRPRRGFQIGILNKSGKGGMNVDPRRYAHLVELGTKRKGKVRNKPRPFLRPAFDGRWLATQIILKERLWRGINRLISKRKAAA